MSRIYVDCDDTLVIWLNKDGQPLEGQNPYGGGSDRWEWNVPLANALVELWENEDAEIIVWSGGGVDYAGNWVHRLGWELMAGWMSKDIRIVQPGDICIDDAQLKIAGTLLTPDQFLASLLVASPKEGAGDGK